MEKRGKSMVPVHNSQTGEHIAYDRLPWKDSMFADKFCTCPKPLRTVFDVCSWCLVTKGISADPFDAVDRFIAKDVQSYRDIVELPVEGRPITEGNSTKERIPSRSLDRIMGTRKRPSIMGNVRLYPDTKDLIRHLWERLTRKIGLRRSIHSEDLREPNLEKPYSSRPNTSCEVFGLLGYDSYQTARATHTAAVAVHFGLYKLVRKRPPRKADSKFEEAFLSRWNLQTETTARALTVH